MRALLDRVVLFGRELRAAGAGVTSPQLERFVQALPLVGIDSPSGVRDAARATLATGRDEVAIVDEVFDRVWLGRAGPAAPSPRQAPPRLTAEVAIAQKLGLDRPAEPLEAADRAATWSEAERLRRKHFDRLTPEEAQEVRRLLARTAWDREERRTRRFTRAPAGEVPDWRRTIREAIRLDGELIVRRFRTRATRPRPVVLLVDVSGSMERFARAILTFVHVIAQRARRGRHRRSVEVFVFGTRLTRVTRAFATRGVDRALAEAAGHAPDWAGGTRIGEALHRFNRVWARRVLNRGPIVVIVSDGWDQGDPVQIAREAAHLRRTCHRLVWLHPLAGTPGFEPRTRALIAALPFVDALLPGGSVAELERATRHLERLSVAGQRGDDSSSPLDAPPDPDDVIRALPRQVRQPPSGRRR